MNSYSLVMKFIAFHNNTKITELIILLYFIMLLLVENKIVRTFPMMQPTSYECTIKRSTMQQPIC